MAASRPPGTPGAPRWWDRKTLPSGIQIPVVQKSAGRPWRGEEDAEVNKQAGEDDAGTEGKTVQEDAGTGPHSERSRLEQLTPGENLDEGQGSPETPILLHVPGGAWLQQTYDLPYLLFFPGFPDDAIPPRDRRQADQRPEREKRKEEITSLREKETQGLIEKTDRKDL
ncbi:hypothetical protein NDU88_004394 [Pleurodeles waltl]|uniref:Uncharacterized protein n=1 Tax=Pleurodeles waltl TaxID=8319 RepID=A0AAV7VI48_PLEWA|nr:hypothetical protein NDU88_004394 [Pleurodeles waltl]